MKKSATPKLERFAAKKQRRLDQLLEKNREGTITEKEKARLNQLVAEAEALMVTNARRLADFSQNEAEGVPKDAVPVTVWVQPQQVER
jgi:hypothetical protein